MYVKLQPFHKYNILYGMLSMYNNLVTITIVMYAFKKLINMIGNWLLCHIRIEQ